jgi:hypothetical protein
MRHNICIVAAVFATAIACAGTVAAQTTPEWSREASRKNLDAVWSDLKPIVFSSGKAVRLYYRTDCRATNALVDHEPIPFPVTKIQPPSEGKTGLSAVQEIFAGDKNVVVNEDAGVIRIRIGDVPMAILQTKLHSVIFNQTDQYNPEEALGTIISSKEVKSAMGSLRMATVPTGAGPVADPIKGLPHLPAAIRNITVDQALDKIAKTWAGEGIVVYGICAEPTQKNDARLFTIDYLGDLVPKEK